MYTHTIPGLLLNQPITSIPIKTNYGKFNIRFAAVKVWNHLDASIKQLPLKTFITKSSLTSYSLIVHENSTGICSFIYLFICLFIYLCIYFFFSSLFLTNYLLFSNFSANLPPLFTHYLVLLSSISFLVIPAE